MFAEPAPSPFNVSPVSTPAGGSLGPDPFNPASLRLSPEAAAGFSVKKAFTALPVRKPDKSWFVRVHSDPAYQLITNVIELKEDRGGETYLVAPPLWAGLAGEGTFGPQLLATAVSRQGTVFLWPVKMPGPDGRANTWTDSALQAVQMAREGWVKVQANMQLSAYEVYRATGQLPDPEWPDVPFGELLKVAFRGQYIDTPDHPALRRLRGEV